MAGKRVGDWAMARSAETVYEWIEYRVKQRQRDLGRAVYPWEVQSHLPFYRAEGSLRRDMLAMAQQGRLVRVGGSGARQGYRLPTRMERLAWHLNGGVWPVGCERVAVIGVQAWA